ncbi:DUF4919 domain-containing protein [Flammeovirga aprica]|uniref:DUF4919 domain-containing protein n=1 Tax=Flammeovirga aprica JL-4 TaxID=694437 RepID=A0A7X9XA52_9BACT|nr:DUF4919 domain-containing protein [Flammeovirga aprica]NME69325.1 DUF4919 domain-containing protein [Flammeovirga aprica JL-4]
MKKYTLLFILNSFIATLSFAQNLTLELDKVSDLRDEKKYTEALGILDSLIAMDSVSARLYFLRGSCYHYARQPKLSMESYQKTIEMDSLFKNAYFNLANGYERQNKMDSAEIFFRKYITLDSTDSDAYLRLGYTLRGQGKEDSVKYLYDKAYALDSTNLYAIYTLAQEYFYEEDYSKSQAFIAKGKALETDDISFYVLEGALESAVGNYDKVIKACEEAFEIDSTDFDLNKLYIESVMLKKTDPKKICKIDYQNKFVDYNNSNLKEVLAGITEEDYNQYLKRVKAGEILSLEDYLRFYLSQKHKKGFSPYFTASNPNIEKYWKEENFKELVKHDDEIFNTVPLKISELFKVCSAHFALGNITEFRKYYAVYFGILEGIIATGNGTEFESAYLVVSASDEYEVIYYMGLNSSSQALVHKDEHSYDILTTAYNDGEEKDVYFNIDIPMENLHASFTETDKKGKKKKKKRKNK